MASQTAVASLFNGNISETFWRTAGDNKRKKYGYQYDNLNRLTNAIYQDPSATLVTNSYNESITYDKNGNIQTLNRKGLLASAPFNTTIDNLVYSYGPTNKNELRRVADGTNAQGFKNGSNTDDDYAYDANGNMITDKNKGITAISYNQLNLPIKIEFGTNKIEYLYNATGQKMQKKVTQGSTVTITDYLGGFQYNGTVLDFFPHAEGYIKRETTGVYTYVFNYTDHLGNVRVSYKKNGSTLQILEESNYYPFGLKHEPNTVVNNQPSYKYKYNGKELQDELGLNMYDYGARNYDPALGRWMNIDPLAEKMRRYSPYNYCFNNPLRFTDPDGMEPFDWIKDGKRVFFDPTIKSQKDATEFYGASAKHFNEGSTITGVKGGETLYQYTFHDNGTVTDSKNQTLDTSSDIITDGGTIIESPDSKSGSFASFSVGGAFGGGVSLEIGFVNDDNGGTAAFLTYGGNAGFGGGAGFKAGKITPTGDNPFSVNDFGGKGNSVSTTFDTPLGGYGRERGGSQGSSFTNFGDNKRGYEYTAGSVGITPSVRAEAIISETKTWIYKF